MLYGLTTVERIGITNNWEIWYVVSYNKNKSGEIPGLDEYVRNYFNPNTEDFKEKLTTFDAEKRMNEAFDRYYQSLLEP